MESKKFILQEKDIPTAWYNIVADMPVKPAPMRNPATGEPIEGRGSDASLLKGSIFAGNE